MNANIIPIQVTPGSGDKVKITPDEIDDCLLANAAKANGSGMDIWETDFEEFVRTNAEIIFPDETLLIVGQQVRSKTGKRSDLVAVDKSGNIVIIELKRDAKDATARAESLEFQAIRYAANYSRLSKDELAQKLFAPYIERHKTEFGNPDVSSSKLAHDTLEKFLNDNKAEGEFNQSQRIVLVAASFDKETLSACAWLYDNDIDITCVSVSPFKYGQQLFLAIEQIIPPPQLDDFNVGVAEQTHNQFKTSKVKGASVRENLPRMPQLFEWKIIKPGDQVYIKIYPSEGAEVIDEKRVKYKGELLSYNEWGKKVTGWSVINIYEWLIFKDSDKSLSQLRSEKIQAMTAPVSTST